MTHGKRIVAVLVLDVVIYLVAIWVLTTAPAQDAMKRAAGWWHITRVCWAVAAWFGRRAIRAEQSYWEEVQR